MKRLNCLLMAIVLAFGVATLAGHSALHANTGAENCLICASHADLGAAAFMQAHQVPVDVGPHPEPGVISRNLLPDSSELKPRSRAPPSVS